MMQEGGVILDIVLFVGICFVFGVFDLEIYFWCVVGCYSSTSRKSTIQRKRLPCHDTMTPKNVCIERPLLLKHPF